MFSSSALKLPFILPIHLLVYKAKRKKKKLCSRKERKLYIFLLQFRVLFIIGKAKNYIGHEDYDSVVVLSSKKVGGSY